MDKQNWTWSKAHMLMDDRTDRRKYAPKGDPLEAEDKLRTMQGWDELAHNYALEKLEIEMRTYLPASILAMKPDSDERIKAEEIHARNMEEALIAAELSALAREKVKGRRKMHELNFHNEFVHRFREWLRGNGNEEEYRQAGMMSYTTQFGEKNKRGTNQPISRHASVLDYLSQWQDRVIDYEKKRTIMRLRCGRGGERGEEASIDDLWKYYKFVVYGLPLNEQAFKDPSYVPPPGFDPSVLRRDTAPKPEPEGVKKEDEPPAQADDDVDDSPQDKAASKLDGAADKLGSAAEALLVALRGGRPLPPLDGREPFDTADVVDPPEDDREPPPHIREHYENVAKDSAPLPADKRANYDNRPPTPNDSDDDAPPPPLEPVTPPVVNPDGQLNKETLEKAVSDVLAANRPLPPDPPRKAPPAVPKQTSASKPSPKEDDDIASPPAPMVKVAATGEMLPLLSERVVNGKVYVLTEKGNWERDELRPVPAATNTNEDEVARALPSPPRDLPPTPPAKPTPWVTTRTDPNGKRWVLNDKGQWQVDSLEDEHALKVYNMLPNVPGRDPVASSSRTPKGGDPQPPPPVVPPPPPLDVRYEVPPPVAQQPVKSEPDEVELTFRPIYEKAREHAQQATRDAGDAVLNGDTEAFRLANARYKYYLLAQALSDPGERRKVPMSLDQVHRILGPLPQRGVPPGGNVFAAQREQPPPVAAPLPPPPSVVVPPVPQPTVQPVAPAPVVQPPQPAVEPVVQPALNEIPLKDSDQPKVLPRQPHVLNEPMPQIELPPPVVQPAPAAVVQPAAHPVVQSPAVQPIPAPIAEAPAPVVAPPPTAAKLGKRMKKEEDPPLEPATDTRQPKTTTVDRIHGTSVNGLYKQGVITYPPQAHVPVNMPAPAESVKELEQPNVRTASDALEDAEERKKAQRLDVIPIDGGARHPGEAPNVREHSTPEEDKARQKAHKATLKKREEDKKKKKK
jgi:hypothetical protein